MKTSKQDEKKIYIYLVSFNQREKDLKISHWSFDSEGK